MADRIQDVVRQIPSYLSNFRQERLSSLKPIHEFFDVHRISRPQDLNEATRRISHNTRTFAGNYSLVVGALAIYALISNPLLLIAIGFLVGGFGLINRFAPEPIQAGEHTVTQKSLYTGLFCIGIPLLWFAAPIATVFWIVGASAVLVMGHASIMEPSVESEYGQVEGV